MGSRSIKRINIRDVKHFEDLPDDRIIEWSDEIREGDDAPEFLKPEKEDKDESGND